MSNLHGNPEKNKALESALSQIRKQHGLGSIMKLGDNENAEKMKVSSISTGSLKLDSAIGIGGVPRGRIIEIFGAESSGKTTLTLHIIAEAQKAGGLAGFIDAEHALDPVYARRLGVNVDDLVISQPDTGEIGLEICEMLVRSGAMDVIVIDSVSALVPRAEIEGEMGASHIGLQARLMSQALRKLAGIISKSNCTVIFINQLREKIGVLFGSPDVTTGGRALKFYSSVRLDVRKIETLKKGDVPYANRVKIKVVKNKISPPFKEAEIEMVFGEGIDRYSDIIDLAVDKNIIEKSGSWYKYNSISIGQGKPNVKDYLISNPIVTQVIVEAITGKLNTISRKTDAERNAV